MAEITWRNGEIELLAAHDPKSGEMILCNTLSEGKDALQECLVALYQAKYKEGKP